MLSISFLTGILIGCIEDKGITPGLRGAGRPVFDNDATTELGKTAISITVTATLLQENGSKITKRGFCYGKSSSPTLERDQSIEANGDGIGEYTLTISGLENDVTYYIRPYAVNSAGTEYGTKELTIVTNPGLGSVETRTPSNVHVTKAIAGGKVLDAGEGTIEKRGILYALSEEIMNNPSIPKDTLLSDDATSDYLCYMTDLQPSQTYYVRAFVQNTFGIFVGAIDLLTTGDGLFQVGNVQIDEPGYEEVTVHSSVSINDQDDEGVWIVYRGFCWSTSPEPTVLDDTIICGSGVNAFTGIIQSLSSLQPYYIRAYAINNFDSVRYGSGNTTPVFTKNKGPEVQTDSAYNMQSGSVMLSGVVISEGMSEVTNAGFYWSRTNPYPDETDNNLQVSFFPGDQIELSGQVDGLRGGQTYYFRVYATNNEGTSVGNTVTFTTPPIFNTTLRPFPGATPRENTSGYFMGYGQNFLFLIGGDLGATNTDVLYCYSISENEWQSRVAYPEGPARWQSGVSFGVYGFFVGGLGNGNTEISKIYRYHQTYNQWEYFDDAPDTLYSTLGFAHSSFLFYIGGKRDTVKNNVWRYDVNSKLWTQCNPFPVKQFGGVSAVINGVIFAGMGWNEMDVCNRKFWTSVDMGESWNERTTCNISSANILGGVGCPERGSIFVVDDTYYLYEYHTVANTWRRKARLPENYRYPFNCIYETNGKLYIGLGSANALAVYDPTWDND